MVFSLKDSRQSYYYRGIDLFIVSLPHPHQHHIMHHRRMDGSDGGDRFQISKHCFGGKRGGTLNSKHCFGEVERLRSGTLKVESDAKTKREGTIVFRLWCTIYVLYKLVCATDCRSVWTTDFRGMSK